MAPAKVESNHDPSVLEVADGCSRDRPSDDQFVSVVRRLAAPRWLT